MELGSVVYSARGDRERRHSGDPGQGLIIGDPVKAAIDGETLILLKRRQGTESEDRQAGAGEVGVLYVARVDNGCVQRSEVLHPIVIVTHGTYDDFVPSITYQGPWLRDQNWEQAYHHTVTYSNRPGSEIQLVFEGDTFTYTYTRAGNRGQAAVIIDGLRRATVDLYSDKVEWQTHSAFRNLGPGRHFAVIQVLPEKSNSPLINMWTSTF